MKQSDKTYKSILSTLLIPFIGVLIGWVTWVTAQTYNAQQTRQELVSYKEVMQQQQQELKQDINDIRKELGDVRKEAGENHQVVYKILLDLQKQLNQKR